MTDKGNVDSLRRSSGDVAYAAVKAVVASVPLVGGPAGELLELALRPPIEKRRDEWMESLGKRLAEVEARLDALAQDPGFVTTVVQATQVAMRAHQEEKLEALRNAVVNSAIGNAPAQDRRALFLRFIDDFTPTHLRVLRRFQDPRSFDNTSLQQLISEREFTDQIVLVLSRNGLINDPRPYGAINRPSIDPLVTMEWTLSKLGVQFMQFVSSSKKN